jgi:hypothetical protein
LHNPKSENGDNYTFCDRHHEQLVCNNRHNIDIERTSTISAPSVQTTTINTQRHAQQRHIAVANICATSSVANYPVSLFVHRLGSCARAIDFYLYMLCQLRL